MNTVFKKKDSSINKKNTKKNVQNENALNSSINKENVESESKKVNILPLDSLVNNTRDYMKVEYANLLNNDIKSIDNESRKKSMKIQIQKYLESKSYAAYKPPRIENEKILYTIEELTDRIYMEMAEYSVITPYLYDSNVEEINITAWNNIKVIYSGEQSITIPETFINCKAAQDMVMHMFLNNTSIQLDNTHPFARTFMQINGIQVRITAAMGDIIDKNDGIICSIRKINPKKMSIADFINYETINQEIADFVKGMVLCRISGCIGGATGSGKTTFLENTMLSQIRPKDAIITIEEDVREFNLRRTVNKQSDVVASGNVIRQDDTTATYNISSVTETNFVEYLRTRKTGDNSHEVSQTELIELAMTLHPQYLVPGEIKGKESFAALTAALSGHCTYGTIHIDNCAMFPSRMIALIQQSAPGMTEQTIYKMIVEAFPIVIHFAQMPDGSRKCTQIAEFVNDGDDLHPNLKMRSLFHFIEADSVYDENGEVIKVNGFYVRDNDISDHLLNLLPYKGINNKHIKLLLSEERYTRFLEERNLEIQKIKDKYKKELE